MTHTFRSPLVGVFLLAAAGLAQAEADMPASAAMPAAAAGERPAAPDRDMAMPKSMKSQTMPTSDAASGPKHCRSARSGKATMKPQAMKPAQPDMPMRQKM